MRQLELEGLAQRIRARAGLVGDDYADAVAITTCVLGPTAIVYDPHLPLIPGREVHHQATYLRRRADGTFEIVLRPGAPDLRFRLLHEVAHVVMGEERASLSLGEEESAANYIAAAVMAPPTILRLAHRHFRGRLRPIAKAFGMSETATHLRLAEVLEDERVVVTKNGNVFVRSQGAFPWADIPVVKVARGDVVDVRLETSRMRGGIDHGRVALRVK